MCTAVMLGSLVSGLELERAVIFDYFLIDSIVGEKRFSVLYKEVLYIACLLCFSKSIQFSSIEHKSLNMKVNENGGSLA